VKSKKSLESSFYFPHDSNAANDPKCSALIGDFGMEAYGVYWRIIEVLHEQSGKLKKFPKLYDGLAGMFRMKPERLKILLEALLRDYELLVEDENYIWSERVLSNLEIREAKKIAKVEAGRLGGVASGKTRQSKTKHRLKQTKQTKQRKGKERKPITTRVIAGDARHSQHKSDKRNALVDLVLKEFDKVFGFPPIDRKPRFQAYNLIQRFRTELKQSGEDPTDERLEKAICYYFRGWVVKQDSFERTKTLDNIRRNTGVFFAELKKGGRNVSV